MGGNCLKIETARMDAPKFHRLADEFERVLQADGLQVFVTRSYQNKETFGDVDVLLVDDGRDWRKYITERFAPQELVTTSAVDPKQYSFDYDNAQVDFMVFRAEDFTCAVMFYCCGMFGELLGRIADTRGLKFGYFGLQYRHTVNGRPRGRYALSQDPETILLKLGLEPRKSPLTFQSIEEMFDYLLSSRYFNGTYFDLSHLNHDKRAKNKKRKEYMAFLEYMQQRGDVRHAPELTTDEKLAWTLQEFPDLKEWMDELERKAQRDDNAKAKFNGKTLTERFGWTGADLSIMRIYQDQITEQHGSYTEYVLKTPLEQLFAEIQKLKESL